VVNDEKVIPGFDLIKSKKYSLAVSCCAPKCVDNFRV
jgi:hypothetical protein